MAEQSNISGYSGKNSGDNKETAEILKEALLIVNELAKTNINFNDLGGDGDELEELIERAQKLKKNRLFVLK